MRLDPLPASVYSDRIKRLQEKLQEQGLDLFVGYSSECESATSRYLTGFWPFFDFAAVLVPARGNAALVTGGPESYEFAKSFARSVDIYINPLLVETSAPDWVTDMPGEDFSQILKKVCGNAPSRIGLGNQNIFPFILLDDLKKALPQAEFLPADNLLLKIQAIKQDEEIPYIIEAYKITEKALIAALGQAKAGKREWELEAKAKSEMILLGAEGTPYPPWVCSGPNTKLSLCRSTDRPIEENDLVQLTIGTKYMGYCGNMCRPFALGKFPPKARKLADAALEAVSYVLETIKSGMESSQLFKGYYDILSKYGYEDYTLYGPAHGTGSSEVEGLWLSRESNFIIKPNMLFNIDIWLSDNEYGLRYEDGILITPRGIKELTSYRREVIEI
ncbi:MAG: M24 family metallopeptidase [Actinomycetota bacterium]